MLSSHFCSGSLRPLEVHMAFFVGNILWIVRSSFLKGWSIPQRMVFPYLYGMTFGRGIVLLVGNFRLLIEMRRSPIICEWGRGIVWYATRRRRLFDWLEMFQNFLRVIYEAGANRGEGGNGIRLSYTVKSYYEIIARQLSDKVLEDHEIIHNFSYKKFGWRQFVSMFHSSLGWHTSVGYEWWTNCYLTVWMLRMSVFCHSVDETNNRLLVQFLVIKRIWVFVMF